VPSASTRRRLRGACASVAQGGNGSTARLAKAAGIVRVDGDGMGCEEQKKLV
jgi:hypothetical protein